MSVVFNMVGGGGISETSAILAVRVQDDFSVTATKGAVTLTPKLWTLNSNNSEKTALFIISQGLFDANNAWTITAISEQKTITRTITISAAKHYEVNASMYTGYLYNAGTYEFQYMVPHRFVSYNSASVSNAASYINVSLSGGAQREGGVEFGPVVLGANYTFSVNNANGYNILVKGGASLTQISRVGSMTVTSGEKNMSANTSGTYSFNTDTLFGQYGYIYLWAYFDYAWSNARTSTRFNYIRAT